jgi:DNA topoisomerase-1
MAAAIMLRDTWRPCFSKARTRGITLANRSRMFVQEQEMIETEIVKDPVESAKIAGLRYMSDDRPGIRRRRVGEDFEYIAPDGERILDPSELERISALGIPPAWTDVWICPSPNGHIQATGRDAKGRKQYRYHPRWRATRDETKYARMLAFGAALPLIRQRVEEDLARPGLPREKVLAAVVRLLETTLIRVGNAEYARDNEHYGLTTMRDKHVDVNGAKISFEFVGKSGIHHMVSLKDRRLARIVQRCRDLPGYELFQYIDEQGQRQDVGSADVNAYLREITGQEFTAKDFRTWAGTMLASLALQEIEASDSDAEAKKKIARVVESVAERLGNTPTICRKCYIHPAVIDAYLEGSLLDTLAQWTAEELAETPGVLKPEETAVMRLLQSRLQQEQAQDKARDRKRTKVRR